MRFRLILASLLMSFSLGSTAANAQALLPHAIDLNFGNLEEQGLELAKDAARLSQFQQYDLALPRARLAVQLAPNAYQTLAILGSIYLRLEDYDKAIANLGAAYKLKADNPAVLFGLGSAYLRNRNYNLAIERIKAGLAISPKEPAAIFDLGNAYFLTQRYDDAIAEYNRVIALDSKFWAATNNIGLVEYERGKADLALNYWQQAIAQAEKAESEAAEPMLAVASALYVRGDRDKAVKMGEAALKIDPRYGKPEFLKENLWGDKLLAAAKELLAQPALQRLLQSTNLEAQPTAKRR